MNLFEQILRKIFCLHEWTEKERIKVVWEHEWQFMGWDVVYVCKKCGKFKKLRL